MRVNMHCRDHNGKQAPGPGNKFSPPPLSSATLLNSREKGKSVFYLNLKLFNLNYRKPLKNLHELVCSKLYLKLRNLPF